jgi:uncharacterized protein
MTEQENTRIVQDAYAAFGRHDMATLLGAISEDVDWHGVIGASRSVPMRGPRHGHAQVAQFFQQVGENIHFTKFEPQEFVAQHDKVVALGRYEGTSTATGRAFVSDFVMVFTLSNGKIIRFREFLDATNMNAAF